MEAEKKIDWTARIEKLSKEVGEAKENAVNLRGRLAALRDSVKAADEKLTAKTRELITLLRGERATAKPKASKSPAAFAPRSDTAPLILRCLMGYSVPLRGLDIAEEVDRTKFTIYASLQKLRSYGMAEQRDEGWVLTQAGRAWIEKHNPGLPKKVA